jgi:hypothetical protein
LSGELTEQFSPWRDHGRRKTSTNEGDAFAVVDLVDESVGNLAHNPVLLLGRQCLWA